MNGHDLFIGCLIENLVAGGGCEEQIVIRAAGFLGGIIGDVANLLAPDMVVLGGGLIEAMPELFVREVEKAAAERVMPSLAKGMKIVAAKLGDDAGFRGAAAWAKTALEEPKPT